MVSEETSYTFTASANRDLVAIFETTGGACDHNYVNGVCSNCNYIGVQLMGTNLSLEGNIGLNFYFDIDKALVDNTVIRLELADGIDDKEFEYEASDGIEETVEIDGKATPLYKFTCEVNAKEMTDTITVEVLVNDVTLNTYEWSVSEYAGKILESDKYQAAHDLTKTMLNYGAYAQTYFEYKTGNLANANTTLVGTVELSGVKVPDTYQYNVSDIDGLFTFEGVSLVLKSETKLKVYFKPVADINNLIFTVDETPLKVVKSGSYYVVAIDNIAAQDLDKEFEITVTDVKDSTKKGTIKVSALSYCRSVLNRDTDETYTDTLKDLLKVMFLYNQAANTYFESLTSGN